MLYSDLYFNILEFLNLNDLRTLLITTSELSAMARKTTHYKECHRFAMHQIHLYGRLKITEDFTTFIKYGNIHICKYIFRMRANIDIHSSYEYPFQLACQ